MATHEARVGQPMTADEFGELEDTADYRFELHDGLLVCEPRPGRRHQRVAARLIAALETWSRGTEWVVLPERDFLVQQEPPTILVPDVAVVRRERLVEGPDRPREDLAPDLAIEIVSPSNSAPEVQRKVLTYLRNGVREVWVAYPDTRTVVVHLPTGEARLLGDEDVLAGELLPGFQAPVVELFRF